MSLEVFFFFLSFVSQKFHQSIAPPDLPLVLYEIISQNYASKASSGVFYHNQPQIWTILHGSQRHSQSSARRDTASTLDSFITERKLPHDLRGWTGSAFHRYFVSRAMDASCFHFNISILKSLSDVAHQMNHQTHVFHLLVSNFYSVWMVRLS